MKLRDRLECGFWTSIVQDMFHSKGKVTLAKYYIDKKLIAKGLDPETAYRDINNIWLIGSTADKVFRIRGSL